MLKNQFVTAPKRLPDMPARDARHILAARSWCILRKAGVDPLERVSGYLQSIYVAVRFGLLMETVTQIWPEPFGIHRSCCGLASVDELLLANTIRLAACNARPEFDRLLREMLPGDARDVLFARGSRLYG